jgi:hypothetical protein
MGQTPLFCQKALVEEIKELTKDMLFKNPGGEDLIKLQVFSQSLPIPKRKETQTSGTGGNSIDYDGGELEEAVFKCPWCVVKVEDGSITGINEGQMVSVAIGFGIYNPDTENNGHEEILNLIQRVYGRFATNPLLDRQYTCNCEFEWALQEEDTYPYFFGAIGTVFKFRGFQREVIF